MSPDPQPIPCNRALSPAVIVGALVLCCVAVVAYLPALRSGFIWDDDTLVTGNSLVRSASGLRKFWFTAEAADYWPVTMSSFWLQFRLWGTWAAGYHAVSVGLHVAEALLLWAVLGRMRIPGAYVAAFLFAVHPVNVETVAWISEQKNLMAMLFLLASTWWFLGWGIAERRAGCYALSLGAFTLAMLSKGSVAILPLVFLGIIAWHRPVTLRDILRLAPFLVVAAVLTAVNVWFQSHGSPLVIRQAGWLERLLGAPAVVGFYLGRAVWPWNLMFIYPEWHVTAGDLRWWLPLGAVAVVTAVLWGGRKGRSRPLLFGWGFFCVALIPVMGFADVYFMKYSLVADHYQHIAIIGVVALAGAGWSRWAGRGRAGWVVAAAVIGCLTVATYRQCRIYRDAETLYRATLRKNPRAWIADTNLGLILFNTGRVREAIPHYEAALRNKPDLVEADIDMGISLAVLGRPAEGIVFLRKAERLNPGSWEARYNLGIALGDDHRYAEAAAEFEAANRIKPALAEGQNHLGEACAQSGQPDRAIAAFSEAIRLRPDFVLAHDNLGAALAQAGRLDQAAAEFAEASRLQPADPAIHNNLGCTLAQLGRNAEARGEFEKALRLSPDDAEAKANLARLAAMQQRP